MSAKTIVIDGYIGPMGYSKQFIRNELSGQSANQVIIKISSLGGSVDDALNIHDQFIEHGDVVAELSAFVASSATIVSLGARTIRMNENSFYLIHKAMNWVDEWGRMNEDELEALIAKLENQKQQLAKVTLQLARMYVKKTGKTLEQIIALMKQQSWLTAEEAKEWGFIDEVIIPEVDENYLDNTEMMAMISSGGYPAPVRKEKNGEQNSMKGEDSFFMRIYNRLIDQITEIIPKNRNTAMKKQFIHLNSVLRIEQLEGSEEGAFLNEAQLELIEQRLELNGQLVSERDNATAERDGLNTALETAKGELLKAYDLFNAIDRSVAAAAKPDEKAEAIKRLLAARPAAAPVNTLEQRDSEQADEIDWETIDRLPHNKHVDRNT